MFPRDASRRQVIVAAILTSFLMCLSGLIYRVMAAPSKKEPLDPRVAEHFPTQIGEWRGEDVPVDDRIRDVMDVDAYVSRQYSRRNGSESVSMYFPCGTDAAELLQHIPENCYVGAGWTLVDRRPMNFRLRDGRTVPASILQFTRSSLDLRRLVLFHTLVVDGEYFSTFSAVARAKGWRHFGTVRYVAQVQIIASAAGLSMEGAMKLVMDFALDAIPAVDSFFDEIDEEWSDHESD